MRIYILIIIMSFLSLKSFCQIDLSNIEGKYSIEVGLRASPQNKFIEFEGNATFEKGFTENQLQESFTLLLRGREFKGTAFINKSKFHERFELFQIDENSSQRSTIFLLGKEDNGKLKFSSEKLSELPQWGKAQFKLKWEYIFFDDGSFKKEMLEPDANGEYFVKSYYNYKKS